MDHTAWFQSWDSLYKIMVSAIMGYVILICYVRLAGNRSTAKMNNFDWIVTVAVGSILASMAVVKDVTVADGALALGLLLGFQYLLTTATARWQWARSLFLAAPQLLYSQGKFHEAEMRSQRVSLVEIQSAIRESGAASMREVLAVILEPDAKLSVVKAGQEGSTKSEESIPGYEDIAGKKKP